MIQHTHTTENYLTTRKKERNLAVWDNLDGPWGHHTKWNESDRERQRSHLYRESKKKKPPKFIETEKSGFQESGSSRNKEMLVKGYRLPVMRWIPNSILGIECRT